MFPIGKRMILLILTLMLGLCAPAAISAAAFEITPTLTAAVDKTAAAAGGELQSAIRKHYNEFLSLRDQERTLDAQIKTTHDNNSGALSMRRKETARIDADKVAKLDSDLKQTRERYQPLFDLYTAQNRQIAAARAIGDKQLTAALRAQAEVTRTAVLLARLEIRTKTDKLKSAKEERSRKMKRVRDTLAGITPLNARIKAERSAASVHRKHASAGWTTFTRAVKKSDAKRTADSLAALVSLERQVVSTKRKIADLENKIGGILAKAEAQIKNG